MPYDEPEMSYVRRGWYKVTNRPRFRGQDIEVEIEQDFLTDLASSPRVFWALIPPFGAYEAATILHDQLLKLLERYHQAMKEHLRLLSQGEETVEPLAPPVNSVDADGWFRRVMREGGVGFVTRWSMWAAVRLAAAFSAYRRAGWLSWPEAPLVLLIGAAWLVVTAVAAVGIHLAVEKIRKVVL